ncbi:MAG: SDR family oxidoreductase [Rhizobiaceae bacterium]
MSTVGDLKNAIVTGATSGIGTATVRSLAGSGRNVLAIARRENRLRELADKIGCDWLAADVRDIATITPRIEAFAPDIIVNNAGVGHGITGLGEIDSAAIQEAIDINVAAPIQISAIALAGMRERRRGHIVNIGSIAGIHTLVSALYGGTESAIHQFSQNLRFELRGTGIRVTELCPGRVSSEFYHAAAGDSDRLKTMGQSGITELQPEDIASAILFALDAPMHVNVSTIEILPTEQAVGGVSATPTEK